MTAKGHKNTKRELSQKIDRELITRYKKYNDGDSLVKLADKYLPLIKSLWQRYYVRGKEFKDWYQDSIEVMIKILHFYDLSRPIYFGAYYRKCLKNRVFDFIRMQNAKKRIPNNCLTSYSANESYYNDILGDMKATHPDKSIVMNESFQQLLQRCSPFEKKVMMGYLHGQSFQQIADVNQCSVSKVVNAFERCRLKFRDLRNNNSN